MPTNQYNDEQETFDQHSELCVYFTSSNQNIGVAILMMNNQPDTCQKKPYCISVVEICETNHFSNLESILVQINPTKCYFMGRTENGKGAVLKSLLDKLNIESCSLTPKDFKNDNIESDLSSLLNVENVMLYKTILEKPLGMKAVTGLISALHMISNETYRGRIVLSEYDLSLYLCLAPLNRAMGSSRYMRLDRSAIQTMNLFPANSRDNKLSSIFGLLNNTVTNGMGERLLERWLRHPLCDSTEINSRLDITSFFIEEGDLRDQIRNEGLKGMVDIDKYCKKLELQKKCKLQDLYFLFQALNKLDLILNILISYEGQYKPLLQDRFIHPLQQLNESLNGFKQLMNETLDTEGLNHKPPEFLIKPSWSTQLREIMNSRNEVHNQIAELYQSDLDAWGSSIDLKCELNSRFGYIYRCAAKYEKQLHAHPNLMILSVLKSGILFTSQGEGGLKDLSDTYLDYKSQYQEYQDSLVKKVIEVAATYISPFYLLSSYIAQLDVFSSFAYLAISSSLPYCRPTISDLHGSRIHIENARHPLLEVQDGVNFIPNNYDLDRKKNRFIIITGPNMGGKSTYIRELGILILLTQIGCYVPAERAELCLFKNMYARVGAGDMQLKGVSTFMSEMIEASTILQESNEETFVMIDELGRGTSTYDGLGLSWSIAEYLITKLKCFCLFATHFQELIKLDSIEGVQNLHVTAITSENSITMLYEVKPGGCDQSFGIHCAELAHFPKSIIEDAKRCVEEFETNTTSFKKQKYNENDPVEKQLECLYQEILLLPSEEQDEATQQKYNQLMSKISAILSQC